jgi:hypothetical protein
MIYIFDGFGRVGIAHPTLFCRFLAVRIERLWRFFDRKMIYIFDGFGRVGIAHPTLFCRFLAVRIERFGDFLIGK